MHKQLKVPFFVKQGQENTKIFHKMQIKLKLEVLSLIKFCDIGNRILFLKLQKIAEKSSK